MKTFLLKTEEIKRSWYHYDAEGVHLGRLAERIAIKLVGKDKVEFTPHMDCGGFVVVTNIGKVAISGNKEANKVYYRHSGKIGSLKKTTYSALKEKKPQDLLILAVKRMLPKNKHQEHRLTRLKIYRTADHPHKAQNPQTVKI
jgi:large subunit ribosomal protein L13